MKKLIFLSFALLMCMGQHVMAFDGSTFAEGGKYYLYNLYQSKFLQSDGKTLSRTAGYLFTFTGSSITLNDTVYTASVISGSKYKLTNTTGNALMFSSGSECYSYNFDTGFNASKSEWLLIGEDEYNAYKAKNRFTVAALNVDGMPVSIKIAGVYDLSLNPDGKEEAGATAIGKKLKTMGYDVVGVSEDFNFHSNIWDEAWNDGVTDAANGIWSYNATTHRGDISVTAGTYAKFIVSTSPLFDTDGLCLFYKTSNVNQSTLESSESWTAWNEHYGYTDSGADGMIDKGYRYYTVKLADGTEFDLYILHMDAETSDEDNAARESQIIQLADAIKASNNGRPIIVMGDTNCRYTRDRLKSKFIDALDSDSRFTVKDPWIEYGCDGVYPTYGSNAIMAKTNSEDETAVGYLNGEVVDKVFYINNTESDIRIKALCYTQDLSFINDSGEPLADHWPCVVEFDYHTYNPTVDDVSDSEFDSKKNYYFRNKESGCFLKSGGWWGTHAVEGNYGCAMQLYKLSDGKYQIKTNMGSLTQGDPYMDSTSDVEWTLLENNGWYSFVYDNNGTTMALTNNDPTYFPSAPGPNTRYVTCAAYDKDDAHQKWQIMSDDDMMERVRRGTASNPVNATHLLKGANFDRNDASGQDSWTGWPTDATRITYNKCGGTFGIERGNSTAEIKVIACPKNELFSCSHGTTWNLYQQLTDMPNGTYRITCQAFQSISNGTSTTADIYLYGKGAEEKFTMVSLLYGDDAKITDSSFGGSAQNGSYYYASDLNEAALYFNAGYYQTEVNDISVTDGTLTVGIKKTSDTGKSNSAWTCFDNFQIYYLGDSSVPRFTGDVNFDGLVNIVDVSKLIDMIKSGILPEDGSGDMNSDGKYDDTDVDLLGKEVISGIYSKLN